MDANQIGIDTRRSAAQQALAAEGYVVLPALLEPPLVSFLWSYLNIKLASLLLSARDRHVPNTPAGYGDPAFDGLLEHLRPLVERQCGLRLLPTYSYFRLYKRGDVLNRHRDRPACEISISLNIGQRPSDPWPLYIEGSSKSFGALLAPGDALLYRGCEFFHWREKFQGEALAQVFLHYVDRDGPYAGEKFDRRKTLMRPKRDADMDGTQSVDH